MIFVNDVNVDVLMGYLRAKMDNNRIAYAFKFKYTALPRGKMGTRCDAWGLKVALPETRRVINLSGLWPVQGNGRLRQPHGRSWAVDFLTRSCNGALRALPNKTSCTT